MKTTESPKTNNMRILKAVLALALIAATQASFAQSIFHSIPAPYKLQKMGLILGDTSTSTPTTINAWRPIASIVAYSEPGNILMAGAGLGYQHLTWQSATSSWYTTWSVNAIAFAGGSVAPTTPASIMSVGIMGGVYNNLLMAGPVYNFGTKQFGVGVSMAINFNNGSAN